jgi:tRNA threonylcarbamoyladenosine biosynthesis protein TsaE
MSLTINLPTERCSQEFAATLASILKPALTLVFSGDIGTGKTTIIRAMLQAAGVSCAIKSPTFSLVESYQIGHLAVHHFDFYRLHDESELDCMGFRDYFTSDTICCIEWPERVAGFLERSDLSFTLSPCGLGREMSIRAYSAKGASMLSCLSHA